MRIPGCYVWESVVFKEAIMIELKNEKTKQKIKVNTMIQAKPFIREGYDVLKDDVKKGQTSGSARKADGEEK